MISAYGPSLQQEICFGNTLTIATRALFQNMLSRNRRSLRASPDGGKGGSTSPVPAFVPPPASTRPPIKVTLSPSSSSFRFLHLSVSPAIGAPFAGIVMGPCCEARSQPRQTLPRRVPAAPERPHLLPAGHPHRIRQDSTRILAVVALLAARVSTLAAPGRPCLLPARHPRRIRRDSWPPSTSRPHESQPLQKIQAVAKLSFSKQRLSFF